MQIVLLESLGVSDETIRTHTKKLEKMGHTFLTYERNTSPEIQLERSRHADVLMLANMPLDESVVKEAEQLKFIDVAFTGTDHIPVEEARKRGIAVSNASGYATQAVAELCISFMIQLLRKLSQVEQNCRNGGTKDGLIGNLLCGKTIGIIGAGVIGKRVAALCKAFGCTVLAYNESPVSDDSIDRQVGLEELLQQSDVISLHCPLTPETKGLIGKEQLALMKQSAILINTARGGVVDQDALVAALNERRIAGAACDVFEGEPPLPLDYPLLHTPNTIVTPHVAFASAESLEQRAEIVFENLYSWLDGKQINCV